jgi:hypothetical protein
VVIAARIRAALATRAPHAARAVSIAAAMAAIAAAAPALADVDDAVLDAPAPPTLPALAHRELVLRVEHTVAAIEPASRPPSGDGRAVTWQVHTEIEHPVARRTWYVGLAQDLASAAMPGVGRATLFGNPELWGRGVWSSVLGLSSGGTLGVVLPVPRAPTPVESEALSTLRTVRPWDVAYFLDTTLTFRPSYDIRHVVGGFIIQMRQGLDVSIPLKSTSAPTPFLPAAKENPIDLTARATLYLGYRLERFVGVGLEVWEVYQITADVPDDKRAAIALSPSVRLLLGRVAPAFSLLVPLSTPLRGEASSYVAGRVNVDFAFDVGLGHAKAP